jgi:hypothetical protein
MSRVFLGSCCTRRVFMCGNFCQVISANSRWLSVVWAAEYIIVSLDVSTAGGQVNGWQERVFVFASPFLIYYEVHGIVGIVERPRTDRAGFESLQGQRILFFSRMSRPAVGPIQPPVQCVPGFTPGGWSGPSVMYTTDHKLAPSLRMSGTIPLLPPYAFMAWTERFFFLKDDCFGGSHFCLLQRF